MKRPGMKYKKTWLNVKPAYKPFVKFEGTPVEMNWLVDLNAVAEMLVREIKETEGVTRKRAIALLAKDNIFAAKLFTCGDDNYMLRYRFRDGKLYLAKVIGEGKGIRPSKSTGRQHIRALKSLIGATKKK